MNKMKFTIDIEDFWMDEEDSLDEALKRRIVRDLTTNIQSIIKDKIDDLVKDEIKTNINILLKESIQKRVDVVVDTQKFINRGEEVSISDYVKETFEKNSGWASPDEKIKKLAENFSKEMRDRYDMYFASQLVIKMRDQGLLNEDYAKSIDCKKQ